MSAHTCLCKLRFETAPSRYSTSWMDVADDGPKQQFQQDCTSHVEPSWEEESLFTLMKLIPFKSAEGRVVELTGGNELEGMVGFYPGIDPNTIDEVVRLAAKNKAAAVLVLKLPLNPPNDVPVFQIPKHNMGRLNQTWNVRIDVLRPLMKHTTTDDESTSDFASLLQFSEDDSLEEVSVLEDPVEEVSIAHDSTSTTMDGSYLSSLQAFKKRRVDTHVNEPVSGNDSSDVEANILDVYRMSLKQPSTFRAAF